MILNLTKYITMHYMMIIHTLHLFLLPTRSSKYATSIQSTLKLFNKALKLIFHALWQLNYFPAPCKCFERDMNTGK